GDELLGVRPRRRLRCTHGPQPTGARSAGTQRTLRLLPHHGAMTRKSTTVSPPPEGRTPPSCEEHVEQHSARVSRLASPLTGNQHDAEDLTHDVFISVFRSLHSYRPGTFEGWLHRITTNVFLDKMRRKQRIRFDALAEDAASRLP